MRVKIGKVQPFASSVRNSGDESAKKSEKHRLLKKTGMGIFKKRGVFWQALAIHEQPARDWKLVDMAALAGMSRARFAVRFREITGETPADYLASWRVMTAQRLIKQGWQLKHIADDVGYGSASALTRAFARKVGCAPAKWLKEQQEIGFSRELETSGGQNETHGSLLKTHPE